MTVDTAESSMTLLPTESKQKFWSRNERKRWFLSLMFGTCMVYATRSSVPLTMPIISKEKSWNKTNSGIILSSFFWGYTLTQVASGLASDRLGGQRIMWFAAVGWAVTTLALPQIINACKDVDYSVPIVATARAINGAFQGMHFPSMISLTSQKLQESDRASFFSMLMSGSALGTLLTGSLGSYVMDNYGWSIVFQLLGIISLTWAAIVYYHGLSIKRKKREKLGRTRTSMRWRQLWSAPSFWACVVAHACQNNCFFVLLSWMPTYFNDTFPDAQGSVVNMVPWLPMLPCTFLGKAMSERLIARGYSVTSTRKIIQTICFVSEIINLLLLGQVKTFQGALLCLSLIIGGSGFHSNAVVVNPSDLAPRQSGSVFGIMNTVGAVPGFLGVYLAGYLLHVTHSWPVVFVYIAAVDLLGCAVYLTFGGSQPIV